MVLNGLLLIKTIYKNRRNRVLADFVCEKDQGGSHLFQIASECYAGRATETVFQTFSVFCPSRMFSEVTCAARASESERSETSRRVLSFAGRWLWDAPGSFVTWRVPQPTARMNCPPTHPIYPPHAAFRATVVHERRPSPARFPPHGEPRADN